jgi:hypothetical protein
MSILQMLQQHVIGNFQGDNELFVSNSNYHAVMIHYFQSHQMLFS